jgi:hypothetical protein
MAQLGVHRTGRHPTRRRLRLVNAFTRWVLHTSGLRRLADHQVCELRFTGTRSGRPVVLPVMYAQQGEQVVVLVGGADRKRWWRNFARPLPVRVLLRGVPRTGVGRVIAPGDAGRAQAAAVRQVPRSSRRGRPDGGRHARPVR